MPDPGDKFAQLASTRATMGQQIEELDVGPKPKKNGNGKKDTPKPAGMSDKAYQDIAGKWHEKGSME